jgi:hypothetical protein
VSILSHGLTSLRQGYGGAPKPESRTLHLDGVARLTPVPGVSTFDRPLARAEARPLHLLVTCRLMEARLTSP